MSFKIYGAQWLGRLKRSLDDDVPPEQAEAPRTARQYEDNAAFGQQVRNPCYNSGLDHDKHLVLKFSSSTILLITFSPQSNMEKN